MINWGTFMMEVSKTPSVLIGLVFTAITISTDDLQPLVVDEKQS